MRNIIQSLFSIPHSRIVSLAFVGLLLATVVAQPVSALMGSGDLKSFQQNVITPNSKYNKESFDAQSFVDLANTISTGILGCVDSSVCPGQSQQKDIQKDDWYKKQSSVPGSGGAVMFMASAIDTMYQEQPASGITYFADAGKRLNLVQPAYAQVSWQRPGTGYVLSLWRGFRNAAYVLFVLVFVALAFAIMFRAKIDPRTIITIQSALPRIIIALVLITFSWAIAGLLLDFAHVLTRLIETVLGGIAGGANWLQAIGNGVVNTSMPVVFAAAIGALIGAFGGATALATAGLGAALMIVILALLFVFATFRLTWMYLQAYVSLLLHIILGPLEILFDTLPGRPGILAGWFANILAETSVFVSSYAMLSLGFILFTNLTPFTTWNLPFIGGGTSGPDVPFYGVLSIQKPFLELLKSLIGLGIMLVTPSIANNVKESIHRGIRAEVAGAPLAGATTSGAAGYVIQEPNLRTRWPINKIPVGVGDTLSKASGNLLRMVRF